MIPIKKYASINVRGKNDKGNWVISFDKHWYGIFYCNLYCGSGLAAMAGADGW